MKATIQTTENGKRGLAATCLRTCRDLITRLAATKEAIYAEFRDLLEGDERVLRLALAEAEALAWQTGFPHLVFPTLAAEKARAAVSWHAHQHIVRRANSEPAYVA